MMAKAIDKDKFPRQIKFIVGNEAAERFSFYGMRSILTVFLTSYMMMSEPDAKATYHWFVAACYFLPLVGAYISDRYWGKYKTILYLSLFYCAGHGVLALWESHAGVYLGLGLIALGAGGIKPCVSAHVGDQFTKENKHLVEKVFSLFYWSVNFGAFFSQIMIPWTKNHFGTKIAFGIPGILMALATFVFWMGRKYYVHVPPVKKAGFISIFFEALKQKSKKKKKDFFDNAVGKFTEEAADGAKAVVRVVKVFITVSIFWALFDQNGSSWVIQGQAMDLNFMGISIDPSQMQAWNPIMVMALIPLFQFVVYPMVEKFGIKFTPLRKMATGMYAAGISFVIVAIIQNMLDQGIQVNIMWQAVAYLVITCAEVLVSITGLEFAYTQAPRSAKSTIMSFWLLTVFFGNSLTAIIAKMNVFKGAAFFMFFAALMFVVSFIFTYAAVKYKGKDYLES